jgi:hypothetical protein
MADSKARAMTKTEYNEILKVVEQKRAEWLQMFASAKTPESMARAWIFTFNLLPDDPIRALQLAIASLRYGYVTSINDLIDAFTACHKDALLDFPSISLHWGGDPFETAPHLGSSLRNVADYWEKLRTYDDDYTRYLSWRAALRTCFIEFVANRFADAHSAPAVRESLRIFHDLITGDPVLAHYATRSGPANLKITNTFNSDVVKDKDQFYAKAMDCLWRAVVKQPNWDVHGLRALVKSSDKNNHLLFKFKQTGEGQRVLKEIYNLTEKCLFPQLYGPPPAGFFDNYFLDERTGNYIPYNKVNASTSPLKKPVAVANVGEMKDFKNAPPAVQFQSGSAAAAAYPPTTIFEAAPAASASASTSHRFGGSTTTTWSPLRILSLF